MENIYDIAEKMNISVEEIYEGDEDVINRMNEIIKHKLITINRNSINNIGEDLFEEVSGHIDDEIDEMYLAGHEMIYNYFDENEELKEGKGWMFKGICSLSDISYDGSRIEELYNKFQEKYSEFQPIKGNYNLNLDLICCLDEEEILSYRDLIVSWEERDVMITVYGFNSDGDMTSQEHLIRAKIKEKKNSFKKLREVFWKISEVPDCELTPKNTNVDKELIQLYDELYLEE